MPSGLTAAIYEGKDVSLRDYLMRVGRHMGFAVMQRDTDPDEPVRLTEPSRYVEERVPTLDAQLRRLREMSPEAAAAGARADFSEKHAAWVEAKATNAGRRARYEAMICEVEAWEPDPLVESTKENALRYLRESLEFDCGRTPEDDLPFYPEPIEVPAEQWHNERIIEAESALTRAIESLAEERERVEERNRHIEAFLRSLPPVPVPVEG